MAETGAIQELDEDYEDSSDMEDEDELNSRIQKKSTDSPDQVDIDDQLSRSQTEPHGNLSEYVHEYKGGKHKPVTKKKDKTKTKNKKNKNKKNDNKLQPKHAKISKAKSHQVLETKHSYKRDKYEDIDVESVEDLDIDGTDLLNNTITDDDVYLDMSITAEDYANMSNSQHIDKDKDKNEKIKRSSTLDLVKNGLLSAKKRLLSPEKMSSSYNNGIHNNGYSGKDSPHSTSYNNNNYSPTPENNHSLSNHSNGSKGSMDGDIRKRSTDSPYKKSSVSLFSGITSKGKGLFQRSGSSKDFSKSPQHKQSDVSNDDEKGHQHRKSPSKSNLSSIKAKLQNMKKQYSSKNAVSKTPTPQQVQGMESRKVGKKKKLPSKKKEIQKVNVNRNNGSKSSRKKVKSSKLETKQIRKRSSSQNKSSKATDSKIKAPPKRGMTIKPKQDTALKRHSMQPIRSRSQKPKNRTKDSNSNQLKPKTKHRHKSEAADANGSNGSKGKISRKSASNADPIKFKKSNSEYGKKEKKEKKEEYENGNGKHKNKKLNKSTNDNKLVVDDNNNKIRRKSGGDSYHHHGSHKKMTQKEKDEELAASMLAADKKCKFRIKNEIFELYEYYKPIRLIGSGAYAVVCEAIDERTKKRVAIKKNKHIFDDIRDARRILREIKLLLHFNKYKHPDLIEIYDSIPPTMGEIQDFEDVYIVMPLLESNLCKIITSKQKLSNLHYQYLTYQVLRGLKFIHESGVIHRDIKPENILLNGSDCDVKIIDFGLARGVLGGENEDNPENAKATEYVCTRWYRSPEVMCSGGRYDEKMDIWGVGCILAEMILRRPLFPGANYLDQLQQIFDVMGTPKATEWILNDQARSWVEKLPKHNGKNIKKMIAHKFEDNPEDLENCNDLIYKLLELNPADRISAADSLKHPYFKDMHDEDEILAGDKFDLSFEFEQSIKTKFGVRHMMYTALEAYHRKQWQKIKKKQKRKEQKEREKQQNGGSSHHKKHRSSKHKKHRSSKHKTTNHPQPE